MAIVHYDNTDLNRATTVREFRDILNDLIANGKDDYPIVLAAEGCSWIASIAISELHDEIYIGEIPDDDWSLASGNS